MHLDDLISTLLPGIGSRFFSFFVFFAYSCKRDDRQDTHVYFVASLFRFVVVFSERVVSRQSHSVPTRLGWRIPRLSDIRSVKLWITTSEQWSIRYIRYPSDLLKYSMYHSPCTLRFAWIIVVVFIHDVHRNYFTKVVSMIFLFRLRNFKSSNFVEHCRRIWIREKNCDLDMSLYLFEITTKKHPNKYNEKITVVLCFILNIVDMLLSNKLFEKHIRDIISNNIKNQQWFRHNFRIQTRSDKINDFQFCTREMTKIYSNWKKKSCTNIGDIVKYLLSHKKETRKRSTISVTRDSWSNIQTYLIKNKNTYFRIYDYGIFMLLRP